MRCTICGDEKCTGLRHSFKGDPHYERLRDPRNKRIEQLEAIVRDLRCLIWEHHADTVMRDDIFECPVCSSHVQVLKDADAVLSPNESSSVTRHTERNKCKPQ